MKHDDTPIDLTLSGTGRATGGIYRNVDIQGMATVQGDVACERLSLQGMGRVIGSVAAKSVEVSGKAVVRGDIECDSLLMAGKITVEGDCAADRVQIDGAFSILGMLNGDEVEVRLFGPSKVKEIAGGVLRVYREGGNGLFAGFKQLTADAIEGDDLELENTKAKWVRGKRVKLGPGCDIGRVEYHDTLEQDPRAKVASSEKLV